MHDLLDTIDQWRARGDDVAMATVIAVSGSAPRPVGARMAVNARGDIAGSVSGGCVESAVIEIALDVIASGQPRLAHFGIADQTAWSMGLLCGGEIDVFVEPVAGWYDEIARLIRADTRFGIQTAILGDHAGDKQVLDQSIDLPAAPEYRRTDGVFIDVVDPPPCLYIVGASHIAMALTRIAKIIGYRVIVVDPRQSFATPERFAQADAIWIDFPQRAIAPGRLNSSSCVAVLTHDPKIDDPALVLALRSPARYIGALGSRTTHARRIERLKQAGITDAQLSRLRAPIGLDIGARTPSEIALSIAAEMVALQSHR